jgi:Fe2+ transport system protein B
MGSTQIKQNLKLCHQLIMIKYGIVVLLNMNYF